MQRFISVYTIFRNWSTCLTKKSRPSFASYFVPQNLKGEGCTRRHSLLRHCATSRKLAASVPDDIIELSNLSNPPSRISAPGVESASNKNEYQESS
jgi:hypothetical protein